MAGGPLNKVSASFRKTSSPSPRLILPVTVPVFSKLSAPAPPLIFPVISAPAKLNKTSSPSPRMTSPVIFPLLSTASFPAPISRLPFNALSPLKLSFPPFIKTLPLIIPPSILLRASVKSSNTRSPLMVPPNSLVTFEPLPVIVSPPGPPIVPIVPILVMEIVSPGPPLGPLSVLLLPLFITPPRSR